jgi:two-component system heavy metal sensor histidine kinase CusS
MTSLRGRLTLSVFVALAAVLVLFSAVLDRAFSSALRHQLDERLESEAAAVAGMIEAGVDGRPELEYVPLAAFEDGTRPAYFEVRTLDGAVVARSPSLGHRGLGTASTPAAGFAPLVLPDGRRGRAFVSAYRPRPAESGPAAPAASVSVAVARGTEEIDDVRARLRLWLVALAAGALVAGAGAAHLAVTGGLRPAERLAAAIGGLGENDLGRTLATTDVPRELEPVVSRLNDLLARVDQALVREKRFSADAAHELRTPLAGLRTVLEVAISRERPAAEYAAALEEAAAIAMELGGLVESLLTLARLEAEPGEHRAEPVRLRALVEAVWAPRVARAAARGLSFEDTVDPAAALASDETKLRVVVANLLDNAVEYTHAGGRIAARARTDEGVVLEIWDSGPAIPADALPRLFDRFFRVDAARTGGAHCGIGLTLARSLCDVLGLELTVDNGIDGSVSFCLRAPPP